MIVTFFSQIKKNPIKIFIDHNEVQAATLRSKKKGKEPFGLSTMPVRELSP